MALRVRARGDGKPSPALTQEIVRRAALFRLRITEPGPVPLLVLPGCPGQGGCISCGCEIAAGHLRCEVCTQAVHLALTPAP